MTNLSLGMNSLTGQLPPAWGGMAALEELTLDRNQLSGAPARGRRPCRAPAHPLLSRPAGSRPPAPPPHTHTQHTPTHKRTRTCTHTHYPHPTPGTLPSEWGSLTSLLLLDLTYAGHITGSLPPPWGQLQLLQGLLLGYLDLTGTIPSQWGDNPATPFPSVEGMVSLRYLSLRDSCGICGSPPLFRQVGPRAHAPARLGRAAHPCCRRRRCRAATRGRKCKARAWDAQLPSPPLAGPPRCPPAQIWRGTLIIDNTGTSLGWACSSSNCSSFPIG